jgi:uncharacterized membrane protein YdjX (TVP38/TMEM64 family)
MWWLRGYFFSQVMVTVSVSPTRTGWAKCSVWSTYTVPGPGNCVPSTLEISAPPHMPWAMTSRRHGVSLDALKAQQAAIDAYRQANPWLTAAIFFVVYVAVTGAVAARRGDHDAGRRRVFGLLWGTVLVSFASSLGATLAFLASRFLLRDWVQSRFGQRLRAINAASSKEGGFYLFTLRLVPVFPFFMINLLMGLTPMRAWTFYWVSQVGMLAGTLVYVNAGTQLAGIDSLRGILSPGLIGSFALLGIFPLIAKKIVDGVKAKKVYARWTKPARSTATSSSSAAAAPAWSRPTSRRR